MSINMKEVIKLVCTYTIKISYTLFRERQCNSWCYYYRSCILVVLCWWPGSIWMLSCLLRMPELSYSSRIAIEWFNSQASLQLLVDLERYLYTTKGQFDSLTNRNCHCELRAGELRIIAKIWVLCSIMHFLYYELFELINKDIKT